MSLSHQPIARGKEGKGRENEGNNEMEAALVSEMMDWITSLCIYLLYKMRSRKFAGRLRAMRLSLTLLHWGVSLIPGSSQEKAGEIILSSLSMFSHILVFSYLSFLLTDLHLRSPSCDANLPLQNPFQARLF